MIVGGTHTHCTCSSPIHKVDCELKGDDKGGPSTEGNFIHLVLSLRSVLHSCEFNDNCICKEGRLDVMLKCKQNNIIMAYINSDIVFHLPDQLEVQ